MAKVLSASFEVVDDLLWRAKSGASGVQPVQLAMTDRIAPLMELTIAQHADPNAYRCIAPGDTPTRVILAQISGDFILGAEYGAKFGVFPLSHRGPPTSNRHSWDLWCMRLQIAAQSVGFTKSFAQALTGAIGELVSNVEEHSDLASSGVALYNATTNRMEVVVSDGGIGVMKSLLKSAKFASLSSAGDALVAAATDGVSCRPEPNRGYGVGSLFKALTGQFGEVRLRSDDHALHLRGGMLSLQAGYTLAHCAPIPGLTASVVCYAAKPADGTGAVG